MKTRAQWTHRCIEHVVMKCVIVYKVQHSPHCPSDIACDACRSRPSVFCGIQRSSKHVLYLRFSTCGTKPSMVEFASSSLPAIGPLCEVNTRLQQDPCKTRAATSTLVNNPSGFPIYIQGADDVVQQVSVSDD